MNITSDELVGLMFTPMTDIEMVELIDLWGIEQPIIDEQYEMDLDISLLDINGSGITIVFEEIENYTKNGELCVSEVSFQPKTKIGLPFGLKFSYNYEECCKAMGTHADYTHKYLEETKVWVKTHKSGRKYIVAINFDDEKFQEIYNVVVRNFYEEKVGDTLIENKE